MYIIYVNIYVHMHESYVVMFPGFASVFAFLFQCFHSWLWTSKCKLSRLNVSNVIRIDPITNDRKISEFKTQ